LSGWPQIRFRLAAVATVALAVTLVARSQDKAAGAGEAPTRPDAIAGAKKEFERIKSVREESRLSTGGLPRFGVPELPAQLPLPVIVPNRKISPVEPKPGNWLVDAMEKQKISSDSGGTDSRPRGRRSRNGLDEESVTNEEFEPRRSGESGHDRKTDQAPTPIVINPLTRFLGEWMTPQDYALLKPGLTQSFDPREGAKNFTSTHTPGSSLTLGGLNDFAFGGQGSAPSVSVASPQRDNPYLDPIKLELPVRMSTGNPGANALPATPAPRVPAATAPSPAQMPPSTKIPEFAKPPPDDRYFKQLKRF
jgi:hypothetical protein